MALTGCEVIPNAQRNFSVDTRLIMDVTIGHVFNTHHNFKPSTLLSLSNSKQLKYAEHYQRQRLAFAPIVATTLLDNLAQIPFNFFGILPIMKQKIRLDLLLIPE